MLFNSVMSGFQVGFPIIVSPEIQRILEFLLRKEDRLIGCCIGTKGDRTSTLVGGDDLNSPSKNRNSKCFHILSLLAHPDVQIPPI